MLNPNAFNVSRISLMFLPIHPYSPYLKLGDPLLFKLYDAGELINRVHRYSLFPYSIIWHVNEKLPRTVNPERSGQIE